MKIFIFSISFLITSSFAFADTCRPFSTITKYTLRQEIPERSGNYYDILEVVCADGSNNAKIAIPSEGPHIGRLRRALRLTGYNDQATQVVQNSSQLAALKNELNNNANWTGITDRLEYRSNRIYLYGEDASNPLSPIDYNLNVPGESSNPSSSNSSSAQVAQTQNSGTGQNREISTARHCDHVPNQFSSIPKVQINIDNSKLRQKPYAYNKVGEFLVWIRRNRDHYWNWKNRVDTLLDSAIDAERRANANRRTRVHTLPPLQKAVRDLTVLRNRLTSAGGHLDRIYQATENAKNQLFDENQNYKAHPCCESQREAADAYLLSIATKMADPRSLSTDQKNLFKQQFNLPDGWDNGASLGEANTDGQSEAFLSRGSVPSPLQDAVWDHFNLSENQRNYDSTNQLATIIRGDLVSNVPGEWNASSSNLNPNTDILDNMSELLRDQYVLSTRTSNDYYCYTVTGDEELTDTEVSEGNNSSDRNATSGRRDDDGGTTNRRGGRQR